MIWTPFNTKTIPSPVLGEFWSQDTEPKKYPSAFSLYAAAANWLRCHRERRLRRKLTPSYSSSLIHINEVTQLKQKRTTALGRMSHWFHRSFLWWHSSAVFRQWNPRAQPFLIWRRQQSSTDQLPTDAVTMNIYTWDEPDKEEFRHAFEQSIERTRER